MDEPYLTFIAQSKYAGKCFVFNCPNRWNAGEPCYWRAGKGAFCETHGESLNEQKEMHEREGK